MINAAIVGLGRWGRTLVEAVQGKSGTLAMVRSTPAYLRVHAFGRNVSAEALGRNDLVLRRSGAEPQHLSFPPIDSVGINLEPSPTQLTGAPPIRSRRARCSTLSPPSRRSQKR